MALRQLMIPGALLWGCLACCEGSPPPADALPRDATRDQRGPDAAIALDARMDLRVDSRQPDAPPPKNRFFQHEFPDCQAGGLFNCTPSIELCADGTAFIMVTDIVNKGTYQQEGLQVTTRWDQADVPATLIFASSTDGQTLTDDWQGWSWALVLEPQFPFCPDA